MNYFIFKMNFIFIFIFSLNLFLVDGLSKSPGALVHLNTEGVNKIIRSLVQSLNKKLTEITVDEVTGSDHDLHYKISSIKIHCNIDPNSVVLKVNQDNSLSFTVGSVSGAGNADYNVKYWIVKKSGHCDVSFKDSSISVTLKLEEKNEIPQINLISIDSNVHDLKYHCHGDLLDQILNILDRVLTPIFTRKINKIIRKKFEKSMPKINTKFSQIKMVHELPRKLAGFFVNYGISSNPTFTPAELKIPIISQFYYQNHSNDNPNTVYPSKNPFPSPASPQLFCVNIDSNLAFRSAVYAFNVSGKNVFEFNQDLFSQIPTTKDFFKCGCSDDNCLVTLLPELSQNCPKNASFSMSGNIKVEADLLANNSGLIFYVFEYSNFTIKNLLNDSLHINAKIGVLLQKEILVKNNSVHGKADVFYTELSASYNNSPVVSGILNKIWEFGLKNVLEFVINDALKDGVPLPKLDFITFADVQLSFNGPFVQVCSNINVDFDEML